MTLTRRVFLFASIAMLLLLFTPRLVMAESPDAAPEDAQARAIFEGFAKRHQAINRRHERANAEFDFDTDIVMYQRMSGVSHRVWEYRYAAPDRFRVDLESMEVICDGDRLWASQQDFGRYALREAPDRDEMIGTISEIFGAFDSLPPSLSLLLSDDADLWSVYKGGGITLTGHAAEKVGDIASVRFDFLLSTTESPMGAWRRRTGCRCR